MSKIKKWKKTHKEHKDNMQALTKRSGGEHNISAVCLTCPVSTAQVDGKSSLQEEETLLCSLPAFKFNKKVIIQASDSLAPLENKM